MAKGESPPSTVPSLVFSVFRCCHPRGPPPPLPDRVLTSPLATAALVVRRYAAGEVVVQQGAAGDTMYVVIDGQVRLTAATPSLLRSLLDYCSCKLTLG